MPFSASFPVGNFPRDLWLAPGGATLYTANAQGSTVTAVDTKTHRVIATFRVDGGAGRLVGNPDGKIIYVTTTASQHSVLAIDTTTGKTLAKVLIGDGPPGAQPSALAVDGRSGILYVATEHGNPFIARVEIATNRTLEKIPIRWSAEDIVFDAERNHAYAAAGHAVLVVDGTSNTITASVPMGATTGRLGLDPLTHNLFVVMASSKSVQVIDTSTFKVTATVTVPDIPYAIAVDPVAQRVYLTAKTVQTSGRATTDIYIIDTATNKVIETAPLGDTDATGLSVDTSSHRVYIAAGSQNSIVTLERPGR